MSDELSHLKEQNKILETKLLMLEQESLLFMQKIASLSENLEKSKSEKIDLVQEIKCLKSELSQSKNTEEMKMQLMSSEMQRLTSIISQLRIEVEKNKKVDQNENSEQLSKNDSILQAQKIAELNSFVKNYQEENEVLRTRCDMLQQALNKNN